MKRVYEKPHITVIKMNLSTQILTISDPTVQDLPDNYERLNLYLDDEEEIDDPA